MRTLRTLSRKLLICLLIWTFYDLNLRVSSVVDKIGGCDAQLRMNHRKDNCRNIGAQKVAATGIKGDKVTSPGYSKPPLIAHQIARDLFRVNVAFVVSCKDVPKLI